MSSKSTEKGLSVYTSRPWELFKTIFLVLSWIILGSHLELVGPTLKILATHTQVSYTGISTILIVRGAGYIFANISGTLIEKIVKKYPEGLLSISFLIASIVVVVTPVITNLYLLSTVFFFQGISQGMADLGGTNLMITMWGDHVTTPLNVVHLGYGIGAVFANLFVQQFVVKEKQMNNTSISGKSPIQIPYSITSFLCLLISIGHIIFSIREYRIRRLALQNRKVDYSSVSERVVSERTEIKESRISEYSPRSCGNGYFNYGLSMSIVWIFYMFFLSGNDQTFSKFFFTYLQESEVPISAELATWAMIIYWLSYSVGRLICAIITTFVEPHIALIGLWVCGMILALIWCIFVWGIGLTPTSLLILGAFTGLVFSPTFPLSFGFISQRLNTNPVLLGLLLSSGGLGAMSFQRVAGKILDGGRLNYFPALLIICVIFSTILFIVASIISSIHQRKLNSKKISNPTIDNEQVLHKSEEEQQIESYLTNNQ